MLAPSEVHGAYDGEAAKQRRHRALADALERFPAVQARFNACYGMRLPEHLACAAAFFLGLSDEEAAVCPISLFGISEWFHYLRLPPEEQPIAQLDERVDGRFRRDPPEFVSIAAGDTDGSHFGLFYDLPQEFPRFVAHGYARDDGSVWQVAPTLLPAVRKKLSSTRLDRDDKLHMRAMISFLDALAILESAARAAEEIGTPHRPRIDCGTLGEGPFLPGFTVPAELLDSEQRFKLWTDETRAGQRDVWFARAREALASGDGNLAVLIGRELHRLDRDATREVAIELLAGGYEAIGRQELAAIARVHHAHRDLRQATAYGVPEPIKVAGADSEIARAAAKSNYARCIELLASRPDDDATAQALWHFFPRSASTEGAVEAFTAILDARDTAEIASRQLIVQLGRVSRQVPVDTLEKASRAGADEARNTAELFNQRKDYVLLDQVLARLAADRRCTPTEIEEAIGTADVALARRIMTRLPDDFDPRAYRSNYGYLAEGMRPAGGATLLHRAVLTGSVDMVRFVLELGVDPAVRDDAGKTAHDLARDWWVLRQNDSNAMASLLAPPVEVAPASKPPAAPTVGARVAHPKFGEGQVLAVTGTGEQVKLTIRFDAGEKVLLARFVKLLV
jgi:hypothetical protein